MATFADVKTFSDATYSPFEDEATLPAGHFGVAVAVRKGLLPTVYVLEGEMNDDAAVVKGRIDYVPNGDKLNAFGFAGNELTDGTALGQVQDYKETFAKMAMA